MELRRRRSLAYWWPPLLLLLGLDSCSSVNDEGRALLRFREGVEDDPFVSLSDWVAGEATVNPCGWSGVECEDGKVTALNLKDLRLKGTLAPELGKLSHLKYLVLHNNSFYGIIPKEFGVLQKLKVLDLGYNNLSGPIPSDLGNMLSLGFLITRGNQFLGSMPSELYDLGVLSESEVDGKLASSNERSITRIRGYATIRRIMQLNNMEKNRRRNMEYDFVPEGRFPFRPSQPSSDPPLPPSSDPQNPKSPPQTPSELPPSLSRGSASVAPSPSKPPPPPSKDQNHTSSNSIQTFVVSTPSLSVPTPKSSESSPNQPSRAKNVIMLVGIGVGAFSLVGLLIFSLFCYQCNKVVTVRPWTTGLSGQLQKAFVTGVPQLKRSELETACEDFSNIIGSLSDCMLYKGTLSSGVEIAVASTLVASAKDWSKHSESQFRKKIAALSKVNHKNFVNLLGYCEEEKPFTRMMVFEYAPNGTLFEHLHIKEAEDLDWAARLRIAMGIAYCLDHMHQLKDPVLLGNLQSTSIYLTDDFAAKVADFEFWSETAVAETAARSSGPLDKHNLNPESIVYKFGLLLLGIISGRLPFSEADGPVLDWASDYLRGSKPLRGIVDPTLKSFREEDIGAICEVIRRCCDPVPQVRPTMRDVTSRLREVTAVPPDRAYPRLSPLWWAELEILSTEAN